MDSTAEEDPTLPLDTNGSGNITRFQDTTTMGEVSMLSDPGTSLSGQANLFTMSSGRMSPVSSRTMKDYATQISELKKENFSLKLRIFYMEERMQEQFSGDHEHIFKSNIELKVECESLRKELHDKHDLLIKASNAVACMEASGPDEARRARDEAQRELQQVRDAMQEKVQTADKELRAVQAEADELAGKVQELQHHVHDLEEENGNLKKEFHGVKEELDSIKESPREHDPDTDQNANAQPEDIDRMQQEIAEKQKLIEQLHESLKVKQTMIEVLTEENEQNPQMSSLQEVVNEEVKKNKLLEDELAKAKQHEERTRHEYMTYLELQQEYQQHISEQQQRLDEFEIAARQMSEELEKREEEVKDLTEALKDAEETGRCLADRMEAMSKEKENKKSKEVLMRDKAISGLTEVIRKKDDEISALKSDIEQRESRLQELTETLSRLNTNEAPSSSKTLIIEQLRQQLNEVNKALQDALDDKLQSVESLERQLRETKNKNRELERKYQKLEARLLSSEELVNSFDERLKEKDKELQELLSKYKDLLRKQQDDEAARLKAQKERDELAEKFDREKQQFAKLIEQMKEEYESTNKDMEERGKLLRNLKAEEEMEEKIQILENQLRSKQSQLEDATSVFKKAENERRAALDELEAAMKRREEDQKRELDSRDRINASKSAEIERLRNEIRLKEDKLQDMEDDFLQLERSAHQAQDQARLSSREAARWREDSGRKDDVITELTNALEQLAGSAASPDHRQLIRLTRENVELKQLLKAKESELAFLTADHAANSLEGSDNPYIESLKRELERKNQIIADERSKISNDTSSINEELNTLHRELDNHKWELQNAKNMIDKLTNELDGNHKQLSALHKACNAKDQVIKDLRSTYQHLSSAESDEDSSTATENDFGKAETSQRRRQKYTKRKQKKQETRDVTNGITPSSSSTNISSYNQNHQSDEDDVLFKDFSVVLSDSDGFEDREFLGSRAGMLKKEVDRLKKEVGRIKDDHPSTVNFSKVMKKIERQKNELRRLGDLLEKEQDLYNKLNNIEKKNENVPPSDRMFDTLEVREALQRELMEVEDLRGKLENLLLDANQNNTLGGNGVASFSSTILPINETSYMEMPIPGADNNNLPNDINNMSTVELRAALQKTRDELGSAIRELADLRRSALEVEVLNIQLEEIQEENKKLEQELQEQMNQRILSETQVSSLRLEVDKLRAQRSKVFDVKDDDTSHDEMSIHSGNESDGISALSRKELREMINNMRKKLQNAEKVNELLQQQLNSDSQYLVPSVSRSDPNLSKTLAEEVGRLKKQLRKSYEEAGKRYNEPPHASKSATTLKSKLPVPVEKMKQENKESSLRKQLDAAKASIAELKLQKSQLQNRLMSTEETVRQQADRLKKTKAALANAGIASPPASPIRSARSHPNLLLPEHINNGHTVSSISAVLPVYNPRVRHTTDDTTNATTQTSLDDTGYSSLSPKSEQRFNSLIQSQAKELSILRQQLKRSRETCKHLRTELDIVVRYVNSLLSSGGSTVDTMLAASVTAELDRCKRLTRKLKEQLAERTSDSSISESDSEGTRTPTQSPSFKIHQIAKMNGDIEEKNKRIKELEEKLNRVLQEAQANEPFDIQEKHQKSKNRKIPSERHGFLTPSSSHQSLVSTTEDEMSAPMLRGTISQATEYVPLPDRRYAWPQDEPIKHSSPQFRKSLPMYQRTIAVTEYLPPNLSSVSDRESRRSGMRQRLPTTSDAENCTASYGGAWTASPRKQENLSSHSFRDRSESPVAAAHMNGSYSQMPSSVNDLKRKVDRLKRKLNDSKRLNRSLKEELDLSIRGLEEAKEIANRSNSSGYHSNRNPADILSEHLAEIRSLRQRLEASIEMNDHLREQLERKLKETNEAQSPGHVSANIYLPAESQDGSKMSEEIKGLRQELNKEIEQNEKLQNQLDAEKKMKENYATASKELERLKNCLVETSCQTGMMGSEIESLHKELDHEKNQVQMQDDEIKKLQETLEKCRAKEDGYCTQIKNAQFHSSKLNEHLNRVNDELDESHHLVRSLKSELALYEKLHKKKTHQDPSRSGSPHSPSPFSFDISELLSEIKCLRVQLERSIEANMALRRQLEEQLNRPNGDASTPRKMTTINIHHLSSPHQSHFMDNSPHSSHSKEDSPNSSRGSARRKLKLSQDHDSNGILMTPPPSASSCGDDHNPLGFDFVPLPGQSSTKFEGIHKVQVSSPASSYASQTDRESQAWPYYNYHGPYMLGKLSDFIELKQYITDGRLLVRGLNSRMQDKLAVLSLSTTSPSRHQKTEYQRLLKDVGGNLQSLQKMLEDSGRVMKMFWPAEIPPPPVQSSGPAGLPSEGDHICRKCGLKSDTLSDISKCTRDAGFASDSSINSEADGLKKEVGKLRKRLTAQDKLLQSTVSRLQTANRMKEGIEHAILKQLTVTHDVLKRARGNLEAKAKETKSTEKHSTFS